jgi:hypothetical protein
VGAEKTMKEHQLVINNFNNGKSLRKIAEIMQRSHIVWRYKKANRLTSKVRKSAKKIFTACAKDGF